MYSKRNCKYFMGKIKHFFVNPSKICTDVDTLLLYLRIKLNSTMFCSSLDSIQIFWNVSKNDTTQSRSLVTGSGVSLAYLVIWRLPTCHFEMCIEIPNWKFLRQSGFVVMLKMFCNYEFYWFCLKAHQRAILGLQTTSQNDSI